MRRNYCVRWEYLESLPLPEAPVEELEKELSLVEDHLARLEIEHTELSRMIRRKTTAAIWERVKQERAHPPKFVSKVFALDPTPIKIPALLLKLGMVDSTSNARRLIQQGGVSIDGIGTIKDVNFEITPSNPMIARVGKKKCERFQSIHNQTMREE